jgi:hypothetical protein
MLSRARAQLCLFACFALLFNLLAMPLTVPCRHLASTASR